MKGQPTANAIRLTLESSPEETIKRLRFLPERAAKLREALRALKETHSR